MNYEAEKANLKKKLVIFVVITVAFTALFRICMSDDVSFLSSLFTGLLMGLVFYIPGRIKEYLKLGWFMTIVISVVFLLALLWLSGVIGYVAYVLLLAPLADMGYSIYRVVSAKKES